MSDVVDSERFIMTFRELIRGIIQDDLNNVQLQTLHFSLNLPRKLMDARCPAIEMLRYLEDRRVLHSWSTDPEPIIDILENSLHRTDLVEKVLNWKAMDDSHVKPEIHIVGQETSGLDSEQALDTDDEDEKLPIGQIRSQPIKPGSERFIAPRESYLASISEGDMYDASDMDFRYPASMDHRCAIRTSSNASNASSGYHSHRGSQLSQRLSELSLGEHIPFGDSGVYENSFELSGGAPWMKESGKIGSSVSPLTKSTRPCSPAPAKANNVRSLGREAVDFDRDEGFRPRAGSLPESDKLIRLRLLKTRDLKKSSVASEGSESSDSHSSQQSLSSGDSSSGPQETCNANSLRRIEVISKMKIIGNMHIPLKKIIEDISKNKTDPRVSDPFPTGSKDRQYQLRFFSINSLESACDLYIDIARDYLKTLKTKGNSGVTVRVPEIEVTVCISVTSPVFRRSQVIDKKFCTERSSSTEINIKEFLKNKQNFIRVTSFLDIISWEELRKYEKVDQSKLDINVELDVIS